MSPDAAPMLVAAMDAYGLDGALRASRALSVSGAQHGDLHYRIVAGGAAYSLRLLPRRRYAHGVYVELTDEVLAEQMRLCDFLVAKDLPFMRRRPPAAGGPFVKFLWNDTPYRVVVFHWVDGRHRTAATAAMAAKMGRLTRRFHDASLDFASTVLPRADHLAGYRTWLSAVREDPARSALAAPSRRRLDDHLARAASHIDQARVSLGTKDPVVQFDFTALNVLWDERGAIAGVVDFEKCQYSERVQNLAWLIKTYARTGGIGADNWSPDLARAVLAGYGATELLDESDRRRLPHLTWLAGCLHANFAEQTRKILAGVDIDHCALARHLDRYRDRGRRLDDLFARTGDPLCRIE